MTSKPGQPRGTSLTKSKKRQSKHLLLQITRLPLGDFVQFSLPGPLGTLLGDALGSLGVPWGASGAHGGSLGPLLGLLGALLAVPWAPLGLSWRLRVPSWALSWAPRGSWGTSWGHVGRLLGSWGFPWGLCGAPLGSFGWPRSPQGAPDRPRWPQIVLQIAAQMAPDGPRSP